MNKAHIITAEQKPKPKSSDSQVVVSGGRAIDLADRRYDWLRGYDRESQLYILAGMLSDR